MSTSKNSNIILSKNIRKRNLYFRALTIVLWKDYSMIIVITIVYYTVSK